MRKPKKIKDKYINKLTLYPNGHPIKIFTDIKIIHHDTNGYVCFEGKDNISFTYSGTYIIEWGKENKE